MKEKNFKGFITDHIIDLAIFLVCIIYIFAELIIIKTTGKTVSQVLLDGGKAMLLSYGLSQAMGLKGLKAGEKNEKVISTDALLGQKLELAETHISVMDEWCEKKTLTTLERIRRSILAKAGISYEDLFDENGNSKDYTIRETSKKRYKQKEKSIHKALSVQITNLTSSWLMSNDDNEDDPYNHDKTKNKFLVKRALIDLVSKIFILVAVGLLTVDSLKEINYAKLIWGALQVSVYLMFGTLSYVKNYDFVVDELRGQKIKRINLLNEFLIDCAELERKLQEKKAKAELLRLQREQRKNTEIKTNNELEGDNINVKD